MTSKELPIVRVDIKLVAEATAEEVVMLLAPMCLIRKLLGMYPCQFLAKLNSPFVLCNNSRNNNQRKHLYLSQRQSPSQKVVSQLRHNLRFAASSYLANSHRCQGQPTVVLCLRCSHLAGWVPLTSVLTLGSNSSRRLYQILEIVLWTKWATCKQHRRRTLIQSEVEASLLSIVDSARIVDLEPIQNSPHVKQVLVQLNLVHVIYQL